MATTRAVVLGAGIAGLLAARVLADHVGEVLLVERDRLPQGPRERSGTPQGRHTHVLLSGGAHAVDHLLPGVTDELLGLGAQRVGVPDRMLVLLPAGWVSRFPEAQFVLSASRALVEHVVRERVLADERVHLLESTDATGLLGGPERVTGVLVRDRRDGRTGRVAADYVVDATGHRSAAPVWLSALGARPPAEEHVDPGEFYSTRLYAGRSDAPAVTVLPDPDHPAQVRSGLLCPIEGDRWSVTLVGTREQRPPTDEEAFARCAGRLRHPVIGDLIADARPLGPPRGLRSPANRRLRFREADGWPEGFVVLGDAACTLNPVHGQGMALAALGAVAFSEALGERGIRYGAARAQRAVERVSRGAWGVATGLDLRFPATTGPRPGAWGRAVARVLDRVHFAATGSPVVARAWLDVRALVEPPRSLLRPRVLVAAARGPLHPPQANPPLRPWELPHSAVRVLPG
ncbi:FAD-dependent oxidoreductase [Actinosynnema pretiosum]|nr:FAD-dependent monooxygenase [Actinosynnema pretiosum]